jgi:hypothetical protein
MNLVYIFQIIHLFQIDLLYALLVFLLVVEVHAIDKFV